MTDSIYHGLVTSRLANFFSKGWGNVQTYRKLVSKYFGATVSTLANQTGYSDYEERFKIELIVYL